MSRRHFVDNAPTAVLSGPINSSDTTCSVVSAAGLPASFPYTATLDIGQSSAENVLVTAAASTTLTITRNLDGLGAFSHASGATLNHTAQSIDYDEANAHVNASTGVHGLTGAVVGTTDAQTLTNKTFANITSTANSGGVGVTVGGDGTGDLLQLKKSGTTVAKVDQAGNLTAQTATVTGVTSSGAVAGTNVTASGTLGVTGNATLGGTVGITGATTVGGTLGVTGASTLHGVSATTVAASGNSTFGGTVGITGNTTVGGTVGVTGAATFAAGAAITGNSSVSGTLTATVVDGRIAAPLYTNEAARDAAESSTVAGEICFLSSPTAGGKGMRMQMFSGSAWVNVPAGSYASGADASGTVSASLTSVATITVPAGVWALSADGLFAWSTSSAQTYTAQLWNSTAGTAVTSKGIGQTTAGQGDFSFANRVVSVTGSTVFQLRVGVGTATGTQLYSACALSAVACGPVN